MSLDKAFDPKSYEERLGRQWERAGIFRGGSSPAEERFSLVIPPPNVTGSLHVGHALDITLQDIVVRRQRMLGRDTLWVPGTDHAGIATQMVVERRLREEGRSRHDLGREAFIEKVWECKDEYRRRIVDAIRQLGGSCDWSRERFTLDDGFSAGVTETFVRLHEKGLIYRDRRLINWCPVCQTALSDLEVERDREEQGEMWSFAYRIVDGELDEIVVATTRPETMLGDTAIAVHPDDDRWKSVIGRRVEHPFFPEREIQIIADAELADPETGSGAVKVTPAHDPNDFECGRRHGLPEISILDETGTVGEAGGPFAGLDRFDARRRVKEAIERLGLARGAKDHSYAPGRCQRCRNIVEPMISTQWFCRMRPLAEPALAAVKDGRIRFVPANWEKTYFHWLESIQDWCISRQLWWGHRIPAWHCDACGEVIVSREAPAACGCGTESPRQDPDVLDTWFSSQLWPFAILGWPERTADLDRYYPTDVLVTGFDIIFFWVARMIMAGLELVGDVPFRTVLFHGLVRDSDGAKMSKTAGNVVDPATLVHRHGADAVRFTLAALASPGSDLSLAEERLAGYRAFMNKLWNATRFLLLKGSAGKGGGRADYVAGDLDDVDRFLVASYTDATRKIEHAYASFRFDLAAEELYHFLWHTYCDWSIELAKPDLANEGDSRRAAVRSAVLMDVLDGALRLLHPIAPFISEELWQNLPRREGDTAFLATARMPTADDLAVPIPHDLDTETARATIDEWLVGPVTAIRSLRASARVAAGREIEVRLCPRTTAGRPHLNRLAARIGLLARARVEVVDEVPGDEPALRQVLDGVEVVIPLSGAVDVEQERTRLGKEKAKLQQEVESQRRKLDNPSFVGKAPAEVVEKVRQKVASVSDRLQEIDRLLRQLG